MFRFADDMAVKTEKQDGLQKNLLIMEWKLKRIRDEN